MTTATPGTTGKYVHGSSPNSDTEIFFDAQGVCGHSGAARGRRGLVLPAVHQQEAGSAAGRPQEKAEEEGEERALNQLLCFSLHFIFLVGFFALLLFS